MDGTGGTGQFKNTQKQIFLKAGQRLQPLCRIYKAIKEIQGVIEMWLVYGLSGPAAMGLFLSKTNLFLLKQRFTSVIDTQSG